MFYAQSALSRYGYIKHGRDWLTQFHWADNSDNNNDYKQFKSQLRK